MEYHVNFVHAIGQIQHISPMSRIDICYTACCPSTQTLGPTLPVFHGINWRIQYLASQPNKPIFYPYNYYYVSNVIILGRIGDQFED